MKDKGSMFTIGIFTTHIPYIAFVCFYALFFLFGYQKIAEKDTSAEVKFTRNELTITMDNQFSDNSRSSDFNDFHLSHIPKNERLFYVDRITKFRIPPNEQIQPGNFGFSNFSRPPPAA
jgi:hypothetical protein